MKTSHSINVAAEQMLHVALQRSLSPTGVPLHPMVRRKAMVQAKGFRATEINTPRLSRARRTALLKALADPRRYELLERIAGAGCPLGCSQALTALKIAPATLSHHIKELESAGLIEVEKVGKFHNLKLRPGILNALAETLQLLHDPSCAPR